MILKIIKERLNIPFALIVVGIIFLLCHVLLLFDLSPFWDGVIIRNSMTAGKFSVLKNWFFEASLHTQPFYHWVEYILYDYVGIPPNAVAFLVLALCSVLVYKIINRVKMINKNDALAITAFFFSYPVYYVLASEVMHWHLFSMLLFFLGWYRFFANKPQWLSCLLLLLAFFFNSLLAFHYFFVLLLFLDSQKKSKSFIGRIWEFVLNHKVLIALPFFFYAMKIVFMKTYGIYANYNSMQLSFAVFGKLLESLNLSFKILQIRKFSVPIFVLSAVMGGAFYWGVAKKVSDDRVNKKILLLSVVGLILAVLPYAFVGKAPVRDSWSMRFLLLTPFPFALLCISIGSLFPRKYKAALLSLIFVLVVNAQFNQYKLIIVRHFIDQSIIKDLKENSEIKRGSIVVWNNETSNNDINSHRTYEMNYLTTQAYQGEYYFNMKKPLTSKVVPQEILQGISDWEEIYFHKHIVSDFKFNGCLVRLNVRYSNDFNKGSKAFYNYINSKNITDLSVSEQICNPSS